MMNTQFEFEKNHKQACGIESGVYFNKADIGTFREIKDFAMENKELKMVSEGKVFLHDLLKLTGAEISITSIPANTKAPFLHKHKNNEEIYIVLAGQGIMHIDDNEINLKEGSIVRVSPDAKRSVDNNSDAELLVMCIQTKTGSLEGFTLEDAEIV